MAKDDPKADMLSEEHRIIICAALETQAKVHDRAAKAAPNDSIRKMYEVEAGKARAIAHLVRGTPLLA